MSSYGIVALRAARGSKGLQRSDSSMSGVRKLAIRRFRRSHPLPGADERFSADGRTLYTAAIGLAVGARVGPYEILAPIAAAIS